MATKQTTDPAAAAQANEGTINQADAAVGAVVTADTRDAQIAELKDQADQLLTQRAELEGQITKLTQELEIAQEVIADLKKKVEEAKAEKGQPLHKGKKVLKAGKKKYVLLYPIKHKGELVTEEVLAGSEDVLAELVASGSGAVQEVK